tara:strand:+ start:437 stop:598 length:162 start_codon:yes stop_codon:yes gene_type:complete
MVISVMIARFQKNDRAVCANPNIWEIPPKNSYFKKRGNALSIIEVESINNHLS